MKLDFCLLTKKKLTDGCYTRQANSFDIFATPARSSSQGGVALVFCQDRHNWEIEGLCAFWSNVLKAELVSGRYQWLVVGAYTSSSKTNSTTINEIGKALHQFRH